MASGLEKNVQGMRLVVTNDVAQCLDEEGPVVSGYCSDCDDYAKV